MHCIRSRRPLCSPRPDAGWMFISAGRSRTLPRRSIPLACLSAGGVGAAAPHPLRPDHDLWGTGKAAGCRARPFPDVCAGCGRGCRTQCDLYHHSLPPRCRNKRQPDRICRRHREKSRAAETGNENDAVRNAANEKIRTFSRWEEVRIFLVWWRRWESNPCPKRVQRRCLRVQAINNIPSASRRSPG